MRITRLLLAGLALLSVRAGAEPRELEMPAALVQEAARHLSDYLRIDTTNPPGNELQAANFLAAILRKEGIEPTIHEYLPGRANLVARLPGTGAGGRPIILLHHMDVVPAEAAYWSRPPFAGEEIDGVIWGRGTVDIKGKGIIDLMTLIHLKRLGTKLSRDVIYLAVADEEDGSTGARWMAREGADAIRDAEILIDEGGTIHVGRDGKTQRYMVSIAEKTPFWLTLAFPGVAGHGSVPISGSAVARAVRAAHRLLEWRPPVAPLPGIAGHLEMLLEGVDLNGLPGFRGSLAASLDDPAFLEAICERDPRINAALRSTVSVTQLGGSEKINSFPNEATVGVDCRLLPGVRTEEFLATIREVVGDESMQIRVEEGPDREGVPASPVQGPFLEALGRVAVRRDPGVPVTPFLLLASTDAVVFREMGIHTYGFEPYRLTQEDYDRAHGNDERLSVENVGHGIGLLTELLMELAPPAGGKVPAAAVSPASTSAIGTPDPGPAVSWITGVPDVYQDNSWSCGAAAFQAVAMKFGHEEYIDKIAARLGTTPEEGTHPARIVAALRELGLEAELIEGMTPEALREHIDRRDVVIVDFQAWGTAGKDYSEEWEDGHYGIAVGYDDEHFYIEDPSLLGSVGYLTWPEFLSRWHDYENEEGRRREYRRMVIVVRGKDSPPPRYYPIR